MELNHVPMNEEIYVLPTVDPYRDDFASCPYCGAMLVPEKDRTDDLTSRRFCPVCNATVLLLHIDAWNACRKSEEVHP